MKRKNLIAVTLVMLVAGIAVYLYLQQHQQQSGPVHVQASPPAPPVTPELVVQQIIETVPAQPPLPTLSGSDKLMLDTLAGLAGNKALMRLFYTDRIIHNIVATIDNLPRRQAPRSVMPVKKAPGIFMVEGAEGDKVISPKNDARYADYASIAEAMDAQKVVEIYVRLYPLFQQAYEELGYPKKYFNDRLLEAIDNLLEAPDIKYPVRLLQPHVLYTYADPELEARSAGQQILMRTGSRSEAIIKVRLREIKAHVLLHMHDEKIQTHG